MGASTVVGVSGNARAYLRIEMVRQFHGCGNPRAPSTMKTRSSTRKQHTDDYVGVTKTSKSPKKRITKSPVKRKPAASKEKAVRSTPTRVSVSKPTPSGSPFRSGTLISCTMKSPWSRMYDAVSSVQLTAPLFEDGQVGPVWEGEVVDLHSLYDVPPSGTRVVVKLCEHPKKFKGKLTDLNFVRERYAWRTISDFDHMPKYYGFIYDEKRRVEALVLERFDGDVARLMGVFRHGLQTRMSTLTEVSLCCNFLRLLFTLHKGNPEKVYFDMKPANVLLRWTNELRTFGGEKYRKVQLVLTDFDMFQHGSSASDFSGVFGTRSYMSDNIIHTKGLYNCFDDLESAGYSLLAAMQLINGLPWTSVTDTEKMAVARKNSVSDWMRSRDEPLATAAKFTSEARDSLRSSSSVPVEFYERWYSRFYGMWKALRLPDDMVVSVPEALGSASVLYSWVSEEAIGMYEKEL